MDQLQIIKDLKTGDVKAIALEKKIVQLEDSLAAMAGTLEGTPQVK